jgi:hypothetical protein
MKQIIGLFCILTLIVLSAFSQNQTKSGFSYETGKWWTDKELEDCQKGDLSGILRQFDVLHEGYPKETRLQNRYNNFYIGNGQIGMIVDPLGAQCLPYILDSANVFDIHFTDREGIDLSIGQYLSAGMDTKPYYFGRNQNPTINYNESWVKTQWGEHGNTHGRGHLSIRNSIFPTIDKQFEASNATISNYSQKLNLWDNSVTTRFVYKKQLLVEITSYTHWGKNRVAVFSYTLKNISKKVINAGCIAEPFVSYYKNRLSVTPTKTGLALHVKEPWLLHELAMEWGVSGVKSFKTEDKGRINIETPLKEGETTTFTIYQSINTAINTTDPLKAAKLEISGLIGRPHEKVFGEHKEKVHEFWGKSFILLPWKELSRLYYQSSLMVASNLRYGTYYPCVSTLTNSSYTGFGWGMDNVPSYEYLMLSGRADYVVNVFKHFRNTMPADPNDMGEQLNYSFDAMPWRNMVCNSSGNYAYLMHRYISITGDSVQTEKILYPILRSFCNFWTGYANNAGGSYGFWTREKYNGREWDVHTYDEPVFEYAKNYRWGESDNVFDVVAPAKWTLEKTIELSRQLKKDSLQSIKWADCNKRLILPQSDSFYLTYKNRTDVEGYLPDPFPNRQVGACAQFNGIYPSFLTGIDTAKLYNTYRAIKNNPSFSWNFNYNLQLYDIMARLKQARELEWLMFKSGLNIKDRLDTIEYFVFSESGLSQGAGYFLMPYAMLNVSVCEMLLQSFSDTVEVFPCIMPCLAKFPIVFSDLTANNGFKVSGVWDKGKVQSITIKSGLGRKCDLKLPENWSSVVVLEGNNANNVMVKKVDQTITFNTKSGKQYVISQI